MGELLATIGSNYLKPKHKIDQIVLVYCMCKKLRRWSKSEGLANHPWVRWPNTEAGAFPLVRGGPIGVVECGYEAFKSCIWVVTGMVGLRIHVVFHLSLWSLTDVEPMDGCALDCVSYLGWHWWGQVGRPLVGSTDPTKWSLVALPCPTCLWCLIFDVFAYFSCISKDLQVLVEPYEFENNVTLWCWLFFHFWCWWLKLVFSDHQHLASPQSLAHNMGTCVWVGLVTRHSNKILDSTSCS
jgi:hypothetical protein